jgi:hypothetical protein
VFAGVLAAACGGSDDHPSDVRYRIEIANVGQIVDDEGPGGSSGGQAHLTRLDDGRILFWDHYRAWQIRVYSRDLEFLTAFGRLGDGPGEFRRARFQGIIGDTLFVFDESTGRISLLSPVDFRHIETRLGRMGQPLNVRFSPDGFMIANNMTLSPEGIVLPLRELDTQGNVVHSFGSELPGPVGFGVPLHGRQIDLTPDGDLWVVPFFEPRVERWVRSSGAAPTWELQTLLDLPGIEMPDPREPRVTSARTPETPPSPWFVGIWREAEGPLWLNLAVPHPSWQERLRLPETASDATFYSPSRTQRVTNLIAVDPTSGEIIASRVLDEHWWWFIGDGLSFSWDVGDDFVPYLDLWRPRLVVETGGP